MKRSSFLMLLVLFVSNCLFAQTMIDPGDVWGTWTKAASPYIIDGDITIPNDSTLTIEPGVVVAFQGNYALYIQGRILAQGNATDSIYFTVNDTTGFSNSDSTLGGWHGMRFYDTPTNNDTSRLSYCDFKYGKAVAEFWYDNTGGAVCVLNFDKVKFSHCRFSHNLAFGPDPDAPSGGAVFLAASDVIFEDCTFSGNHARANGGAIQMQDCHPQFIRCIFERNFARDGGALMALGEGSVHITDSEYNMNIAEEGGGALKIWNNMEIKLDNTDFGRNSARLGGGIAASTSHLSINECEFYQNNAEKFGAGISAEFCSLFVDNTDFFTNYSDWGGGIHSWENDIYITNSSFSENTAAGLSGGIHADFTRLSLKNTSFIFNSASMSGGVHSWYSDIEMQSCRFEENTADFGGGLHCDYSTLVIDSTVFKSNSARAGGGIHSYNCDLMVNECLFNKNEAQAENGGAVEYRADSTIFGMPYQVAFSNSRFNENSAAGISGGLYVEQLGGDISLIDLTVDNCAFNKNHADRFAPFRLSGAVQDFAVSNCKFMHNTTTRWAAGPGFIAGCSGKVSNCLFFAGYATYSDSTYRASGATLGNRAQVDFYNCTFADTADTDGYGLSARRNAKAILLNCIIRGCGYNPIHITTADSTGCEIYVNYCNLENGADSIFISDSISTVHWGSGNLAVNPGFIDLSSGDLHLADSSLCIGAGVNCLKVNDQWHCAPEFDIEGNARPSPDGSVADMGAYEHVLEKPASVSKYIVHLPKQCLLHQNYPNPFNPVTTIKYELAYTTFVEVSIYNVLGQKIITLVSDKLAPGRYKAVWLAHENASGVYYYCIKTDHWHEVKKMILLH